MVHIGAGHMRNFKRLNQVNQNERFSGKKLLVVGGT